MKLVKIDYKYINIDAISYISNTRDGNRAVIHFIGGDDLYTEFSFEQVVNELVKSNEAEGEGK